MKVEKIDIKREILEIPDGRDRVDFAIRPDLSALPLLNKGEVPQMYDITSKRETYLIRKVAYGSKNPKNYAVKIDDRGLFSELTQITNNMLNEAVEKKTDWWRHEIMKELGEQRWRIRTLPWWKRLLGKF